MHKVLIAVAAAALLLTGCTKEGAELSPAPSSSTTVTQTQEPTTPPSIEDSIVEPEPTSEPPAAESDEQIGRFGETYTWDDGLAVVVSKPSPFRPSSSAAGTTGYTKFVQFTITVTNKTGSKVNLVGVTVVMSGEADGSEVFDFAKGLEGAPMAPLLNGRKVTYKVAFGVRNPSDVVLEYTPTFAHDGVVYTSTGK